MVDGGLGQTTRRAPTARISMLQPQERAHSRTKRGWQKRRGLRRMPSAHLRGQKVLSPLFTASHTLVSSENSTSPPTTFSFPKTCASLRTSWRAQGATLSPWPQKLGSPRSEIFSGLGASVNQRTEVSRTRWPPFSLRPNETNRNCCLFHSCEFLVWLARACSSSATISTTSATTPPLQHSVRDE